MLTDSYGMKYVMPLYMHPESIQRKYIRLISAKEYENNPYDKIEIYDLIKKAKSSAPPSTAMGIDALILSSRGYTAKDIGKHFAKTANTITALMSKARKYLCKIPGFYSLYTA